MKVLCIVTNGFEEVEFVGTVGILRRGNVDIDIFSIHGSKAIGRYGIEVSNLYNFKDIDVTKYDLLLIPGGPEYVEMENNMEFLNIIKYFYNSNKYIAAICAGPTILGHLGILKNMLIDFFLEYLLLILGTKSHSSIICSAPFIISERL